MISGILLDLSGVLYTENLPVQGAAESLLRLQSSGLPIRYVTNTTRKPRHKIHQQLLDLGADGSTCLSDCKRAFTFPADPPRPDGRVHRPER